MHAHGCVSLALSLSFFPVYSVQGINIGTISVYAFVLCHRHRLGTSGEECRVPLQYAILLDKELLHVPLTSGGGAYLQLTAHRDIFFTAHP